MLLLSDDMSYHKKLLKDIIASKNLPEDATDIASATLKDTDYLDEVGLLKFASITAL